MCGWSERAPQRTIGAVSPQSLREEFKAYGLPDFVFYAVGALKIGSALVLVAGLWVSVPVKPAAGIIALLMVGALAMHVKVGDPPMRSLPAAAMLSDDRSGSFCSPRFSAGRTPVTRTRTSSLPLNSRTGLRRAALRSAVCCDYSNGLVIGGTAPDSTYREKWIQSISR